MGCRVAVPDMQSKRIACNASHPRIGANTSAARKFVQPIGRIAVPECCWGGEATRASGNGCYCRSLDPDGCLARSVAATIEETGALGYSIRALELESGCSGSRGC